MAWITMVTCALMLVLSAYGLYYLAHLPFAPECPACRAVTAQPLHHRMLDRLLARGGAAARECPRCGWSGRMRWRLATERAGNG